jgi:hypothetical protein
LASKRQAAIVEVAAFSFACPVFIWLYNALSKRPGFDEKLG